MTLFQLLMLGASAFFAFKVYEHIQGLKDLQPHNEEPRTPSSFDPEFLVQKAEEAFETGDLQKAYDLFNEANSKVAQSSETLFKMGYILQQLKREDEALECYKKALEGDRENEFIHNSIASIYRLKEEFVSAKMHLNASLSIDNKNPITYYNYGNLLVDMKHIDEAKEMYKKALEIDADFAEAKEELEKLEKAG
ncbi:TPR repeat [Sulfurimonas denitrificans DSM 1251]|uniref:TPR repeat n=1 Tax=Sulfurimonas denitrificans (strain ATCC 33889 / DSM 1251) TaxID=326298 RepID=Q30TF7_SULDN|nr:tetratricopeptide repeat protein [Sulfurimonas denitrificans]ABB43724.1 TPR repeat [Sulfurimonas denitrificans DSM 1251]MDD3442747.1 tetratricopeptide repeat protein [Sulfurimonas denitrificans]